MAFKDILKEFYGDTIQIDYKDKSHRYYARKRVNFDLPVTDKKAWSKTWRPKGTTTILGDTLEKNGLMKWPLGLALGELFGYYNFKNDQGEQLLGFSKGKGTMFEYGETGRTLTAKSPDELIEVVKHAYEASDRKKKQGADIGSLVHDAIEHYVTDQEFEITVDKYREGQEFLNPIDKAEWEKTAPGEVEMAKLALKSFKEWWDLSNIDLLGAEQLIYSKSLDFCGTFDGKLSVPVNRHPHREMFPGKTHIRVLADWKTSNASKSEQAFMWEGINYAYFIQSAAYAFALEEMGEDPIDDLAIVSCRKDGGFTVMYASDLGLTVEDCINWWKAVVVCFRMMNKTKDALKLHAEATGAKVA